MASSNSCKSCNEADNERMVQCDKCDTWYHFDCVLVDSNIANESWECEECKSTSSSNSQASKDLESNKELMKMLEKPKATSSPTTVSQIDLHAKTNVFELSSSNVDNRFNNLIYTSAQVTCPLSKNEVTQHTSNPIFSIPPLSNAAAQNNEHNFSQLELQLQMLKEQQRCQEEFIQKRYQILSQLGSSIPPEQLQHISLLKPSGPTAEQLAARQAIPNSLPHFNGDPEDWPLFISSFETSTKVAGYSDAENLMRLQACLKGRARELVRSKLMMPGMVSEIIQTLRMCFGRSELIIERAIEQARKFPPIKDKLESMIEFALCVKNICSTIEACKLEAHLNNPMLVKELVEKLPIQYKLNWAMNPKSQSEPIVKVFCQWIFQIAEAASTVVSPNSYHKAAVNTHINESNDKKVCAVCKKGSHKLFMCQEFQDLPLDRKWQIVKNNKLCRQCLNKHGGKCFKSKVCGIDGCQIKHHRLLHKYISENQLVSPEDNINNCYTSASVNSHSTKEQNQLFRIIPVQIQKQSGFVNTFAFLDEGSSVTLIEQELFDSLNIRGKSEPLCLRWTGNTTRREDTSIKAPIKVRNVQNGAIFTLKDVHTVRNLELPSQSLDMKDISAKYPYLTGIPVQSYDNATPRMIIGVDNWKIAVPLKVREGAWDEPIATKTRLGWTLQGWSKNTHQDAWLNIHTCQCERDYNELHQMVKDSFNLDPVAEKSLLSVQDTRSLQILKDSCHKVGDRYEVGLLWKNKPYQLPESYNNAYKRLMCLQSKFNKRNNLRSMLQDQINNLLSKGYARKLSAEEISYSAYPVWYLPIFITINPNKPSKVRLVWDAAAKSNGVCLNDFIHPGPDLLKNLLDVLLNFRVGRIAICGDIAEMFHQINVKEEDMHTQRFLWWDEDDDINEPSVYVMKALTFGISCAPCIAHYVRDFNAEQFKGQYPRAVRAIQEFHYVDDFIDSVDDEQQAIYLASQVKEIHAAAGFHIRNWSSNSDEVVGHLEGSNNSHPEPIDFANTAKILGMYWSPKNDSFLYIFRFAKLRRDVFTTDVVPTKREVLQVLMSIFDPMGFLSCYTTTLKILLQEVWRSGQGWDEEITESLHGKWLNWKTAISYIKTVEIPRCFSPYISMSQDVELHTFVDAGADAYAAVCYLRVAYKDDVDITIVAGKSKVAPLKPVSIPRLELQAAVIGVKLAQKVANIKRINIKTQVYWSDSKTVLQWLRMDPKKFQQFVMHRVGLILESTNADQWRYVPSKLNPADLATKTQTCWSVSAWSSGPEFLREDITKWPKTPCLGETCTLEFKRLCLQTYKINQTPSFNAEYFSNWRRLYQAVARFILYVNKLKSVRSNIQPPKEMSYEMIRQAKCFIIRSAQESEFGDEITRIKSGERISKNSKLISLNIFLDEEGILRAKGRASYLNHQEQIILPAKHHVTLLIVRHSHETFHHISHETVINHLRSQYHIPKLRVVYRAVRSSCQYCKNFSAVPIPPLMSTVPRARLASFERPFSYVGMDYFGPILVTVGRRKEKRWGVIFTCLTLRAVHIEIAHSLDTSSCVMCVQNFTARRGIPLEIYSDNGTNMKAASRIMACESKSQHSQTNMERFDQIQWNFNPPAAPHMGGAWERLVRSIKSVLNKINPNYHFTDETLRNALAEVEFIINARPLTFVSLDSDDDEALTPNHLLLGSSCGSKPISYKETDLRQRWHQTQKFADQFWRRWVNEYMPILTRRSKWFEKTTPLQVGDIVIIIDENSPRNYWPKGRIISTLVAKDGQVRQATVKTSSGTFIRPATKIAKLDVGASKR